MSRTKTTAKTATPKTPAARKAAGEGRKNWPARATDGAATVARSRANMVAKMTPAARRETVAAFAPDGVPLHLPTDEAAASDLLLLLNAVGAEFVRTHYPDATNASIIVTKYPQTPDVPEYSVHLPLAVPANGTAATARSEPPVMTAEQLKAAVRAYATANFPGWACSGISFRVGELGDDATETLLVLPVTVGGKGGVS